MTAAPAPLILAVHGSEEAAFNETVETLVALVVERRDDLEVRLGYLDHGPDLAEVADEQSIVVPVLLTNGFHAGRDIRQRVDATVTPAVGPERRLSLILAQRLHEAGWQRQRPLALAAVGSTDPRALADVHQVARDLSDEVGLEATAGFLAAGEPPLGVLAPAAVASYLLARGRFFDELTDSGAHIIAAPIGAHPLLADVILDRYDAAVSGPTGPWRCG